MLGYVQRAREEGYAVLIMNPNMNVDEQGQPIPGSMSKEEHAVHAWDVLVSKSPTKKIDIVAHSYGGICTAND